jgi:hypothetical protein
MIDTFYLVGAGIAAALFALWRAFARPKRGRKPRSRRRNGNRKRNGKGWRSMLTFNKILILPLVLATAASCAPTSDQGACAGWRPVLVADASVDYLAANDRPALEALIGHHETGKAAGCWR